MPNPPKLRQLERRETDMVLRWEDGSENTLSYAEMRYWCPCANCKPRREVESRAQALRDEVNRLRMRAEQAYDDCNEERKEVNKELSRMKDEMIRD